MFWTVLKCTMCKNQHTHDLLSFPSTVNKDIGVSIMEVNLIFDCMTCVCLWTKRLLKIRQEVGHASLLCTYKCV